MKTRKFTKVELAKALIKYAKHEYGCYSINGGDYCTCGLSKFFQQVGNWSYDKQSLLKKI